MKRKLLGFVILALLLIVPLTGHAATAGKFTSVEGNVDVTSPGKEARPANIGDPLNVGDIIRTKSKSKCEVAFPDGSILRLSENSRLRVNEFAQERGKRNATLDLFRGKIQSVVMAVAGAPAGQSKYEIHTPTAVCGVRGTTFFVYHQAGVTGAAFKEGTGYGYSRNRPGDVRQIQAGQAMTVSNPNVPPVVRPATALEMNQHQKDTTPAEKPKSEEKKEEEKKSESVAAKTDESKKEEQKKEEGQTKEEPKSGEAKSAEKQPDEAQKSAEAAPGARESAVSGSLDTGGQPKAEEPQKIIAAAAPAASREQSRPVDIIARTMESATSGALSFLPVATTPSQTILSAPSATPTTTTSTSGIPGAGATIIVPVDATPPIITRLTPDNFSDATKITN
ncbi:MAG: FecR domain-containing protein, partial [Deltaproteobacteria bacterium]